MLVPCAGVQVLESCCKARSCQSRSQGDGARTHVALLTLNPVMEPVNPCQQSVACPGAGEGGMIFLGG